MSGGMRPVFSHHLFLCRFRVRPQRLDYFRAPILGKAAVSFCRRPAVNSMPAHQSMPSRYDGA
jgi:hypothetical protein